MKKIFSFLIALSLTCALPLSVHALEVEGARELLRLYYADTLPSNLDELETLDEILSALGDPHTDYLSAEEYAEMLQSINGSPSTAIGIVLQSEYQDGYIIDSVISGSPADEAGLSPGDVIVAVDGDWLTPDDDYLSLMTGEEGSTLSLTVRTNQNKTLHTFTLTLHPFLLPIVTYDMIDDALVIYCNSFGDSTISETQKALIQHEEQAAVTIVDLRNNLGGTSHASCGTAGLFTGLGLMSYLRDAEGRYEQLYAPSFVSDLTDKPVLILLSPKSASGSELFASILRDYHAGISLGQRSFGKGSVQQLFDETIYPELFDGDCLKITIQHFFSPGGSSNHITGILPTLLLSLEHTPVSAMLLAFPKPDTPHGYLKLNLAGQTLYTDLELALLEHNRPAFTELLEAIPPSAQLFYGQQTDWVETDPLQLSQLLELPFTPRTFRDSSDAVYQRELDTLACYKLLSGYEDQTFRPQQLITRGELCAMLCSALELPPVDRISFSDVLPESWYAAPIRAMAGKGFVSGDGNGSFRPDDPITWQELTAILANISAWINTDGYEYDKIPLSQSDRERYNAFSPWAQKAARNLNMFGALLPDLSPTEYSTREIAAAALCRLLEDTGLIWN